MSFCSVKAFVLCTHSRVATGPVSTLKQEQVNVTTWK